MAVVVHWAMERTMSDDENVVKEPSTSPRTPSVSLKHIEPRTSYASPKSQDLLENDLIEPLPPPRPSPSPPSTMNVYAPNLKARRRSSGEKVFKNIRQLSASLGFSSPRPTDDEGEEDGNRALAISPTDSEMQLSRKIGLDLGATTQGTLKPKQEERMLRYVLSGAVEGQLSRSMPRLSLLT